MNDNPYQAPAANSKAESSFTGIWRDDTYIVARHLTAKFPSRCLICGDDSECSTLAVTLRQRPELLHFFVPLLAIFSPSISIRPSFCVSHRKQELLYRWIGHAMILTAIALVVLPIIAVIKLESIAPEIVGLVGLAFPIGYLWIYYRIFRPRLLRAERIQKNLAWIDGTHRSVLDVIRPVPTQTGPDDSV